MASLLGCMFLLSSPLSLCLMTLYIKEGAMISSPLLFLFLTQSYFSSPWCRGAQTPCPSPSHPSCPLSAAVTSVHQSMIAAANQNAVHQTNRPMRGQHCGPLVAASDGQEEAAALLSHLQLTTFYQESCQKAKIAEQVLPSLVSNYVLLQSTRFRGK